jgi:hypothetical protein
MLVADALDIAGAIRGEAEERADVLRTLGEPGEERVALGLASRLRGGLLLTLATSEHCPSWMRSARRPADEPESSVEERSLATTRAATAAWYERAIVDRTPRTLVWAHGGNAPAN